MSRQHRESAAWFHPSEVFSDTQRVDLFNDPKWETAVVAPRRSTAEALGTSRWAISTWGHVRQILGKRGRHSRTIA